jgi:hypothetical protein
MSDEVNVKENEYMIDDFYAEPFDVVKYVNTDSVDEFMELIVDEAISYYEDNDYSPIIEQKDDRFVIDYYFAIDCLSKFIENQVMKIVNDEKFVKNVRRKIKNDLAESGGTFAKNAGFTLATLDFLDILIYQKRTKSFYSRTLYSSHDRSGDTIVFVTASIFMHSSFVEKYARNLRKIGNRDVYKVEAFGNALGPVLLKFGKKGKTVKQF